MYTRARILLLLLASNRTSGSNSNDVAVHFFLEVTKAGYWRWARLRLNPTWFINLADEHYSSGSECMQMIMEILINFFLTWMCRDYTVEPRKCWNYPWEIITGCWFWSISFKKECVHIYNFKINEFPYS